MVIARGEVSNHCHVVVGEQVIVDRTKDGRILITVGNEGAVLKHVLETDWLEGNEVWTKEHKDIPLEKGEYEFVQQMEFDPYEDIIKSVKD